MLLKHGALHSKANVKALVITMKYYLYIIVFLRSDRVLPTQLIHLSSFLQHIRFRICRFSSNTVCALLFSVSVYILDVTIYQKRKIPTAIPNSLLKYQTMANQEQRLHRTLSKQTMDT